MPSFRDFLEYYNRDVAPPQLEGRGIFSGHMIEPDRAVLIDDIPAYNVVRNELRLSIKKIYGIDTIEAMLRKKSYDYMELLNFEHVKKSFFPQALY